VPLRLYSNSTSAGRPGATGDRRVAAGQRLQLGFLVGADDVFAVMQPPALEAPGVEIKHPAGLGLEVRVAREDPRTLLATALANGHPVSAKSSSPTHR
jgi:hypothetical protein